MVSIKYYSNNDYDWMFVFLHMIVVFKFKNIKIHSKLVKSNVKMTRHQVFKKKGGGGLKNGDFQNIYTL